MKNSQNSIIKKPKNNTKLENGQKTQRDIFTDETIWAANDGMERC